MAVIFGFYFPTISGFTSKWEPSSGPVSEGPAGSSGVDEITGIVSNLLFDKKTFHKYQEHDPFAVYIYTFADLLEADRSSYRTFAAASGGAQFEVLDSIGEETFFAQLMPESLNKIHWSVDHETGKRLSTVIQVFRDLA